VIIRSTDHNEPAPPVAARAATVEAPATLPPSTTAAPTSTLAPDETLPPGPAEKPAGLVAGTFYDALVSKGGVDPGVARCAADDLIATTAEPKLMELGIAQSPRPEAVNELLTAAATRCGITQTQLDAAAG